MKTILITGITGQDGLFLSKKFIDTHPDCLIYGISRQRNNDTFIANLKKLGVKNTKNLKLHDINLNNKDEVTKFISTIKPTNVINLAGPSSVYNSFKNPDKTISEITNIFENLVNSLVENNNLCNFFQASSSEMFDYKLNERLDEDSEMKPNSPYAVGKLQNHERVIELSEKHNWNITSGIMFNHESEFRNDSYLISKVIITAQKISKKQASELIVGSLDYIRDWSFAGDIADAIFTLNTNNSGQDYVVGSGLGHTIRELVEIIFKFFELDISDFIKIDNSLLREGDPISKISNPKKIFEEFGWKAETNFENFVTRCIEKKISIKY
jgi:GDPmannose 4,6-dehydratase